jgi:hypothetical protein
MKAVMMCASMSFHDNSFTSQKLFQWALVSANGYGAMNGSAESDVHVPENRSASSANRYRRACGSRSIVFAD